MLNDTERLTKMRFVNLTIEFDKLKAVLWLQDLFQWDGLGRSLRCIGRNKGQSRKGQVEKLFESPNCERGTENWEIRELGRKEMKPREGLSISYPFLILGSIYLLLD